MNTVENFTQKAEHLGTWDGNLKHFGLKSERKMIQASDWFKSNMHEASGNNRVYRVDFFIMDAPFVVIYQFAINDNGMTYLDPVTREPAVQDPYIRMIDELPPDYLLNGRNGR